MFQSLKTYLRTATWVAVAGLFAAVLRPVVEELGRLISENILPRLSHTALSLLALGLFLCCCLLGAFLYEARSRDRKIRQYEPDTEFPELLRHKLRHSERVCPSCLFTDGVVTPVFLPDERWIACCRKGCEFRCEHPKHKSRGGVITIPL